LPVEGREIHRMAKDTARPAAGLGSDASLKRYLEDIRKIPQLRADAESELFQLYRKGSRAARERIIAANMRFVVKVALEYRSCPTPMSDLISEGSLGLIHAVETFDPGRGVKFISYAVWWIRSHITKALNEKGYLIRLPANQYFRLRKALQAERGGAIEEEDLRVIRQLSQGCASLYAPQPGTGRSWSDILPDPAAPDPELQAELAVGSGLTERMLDSMPEREGRILRRTYGIGDENPVTLKEVGVDLSLSAERVRQLRALALRRMRSDPAYAPLRERYACLAEARPA
jgi:RNA polymerase primary sigma factor